MERRREAGDSSRACASGNPLTPTRPRTTNNAVLRPLFAPPHDTRGLPGHRATHATTDDPSPLSLSPLSHSPPLPFHSHSLLYLSLSLSLSPSLSPVHSLLPSSLLTFIKDLTQVCPRRVHHTAAPPTRVAPRLARATHAPPHVTARAPHAAPRRAGHAPRGVPVAAPSSAPAAPRREAPAPPILVFPLHAQPRAQALPPQSRARLSPPLVLRLRARAHVVRPGSLPRILRRERLENVKL